MENHENLIEVRNLCKSFGDLVVLDHVNLDVPRGKTTCIVGTSGSGKSTLMRLMTGLLQANCGALFFDDRDMTKLGQRSLEKIRKDIGMVFQYSALLGSLTVFDNVALPLREARKHDKELRKIYTDEYIHNRVMECLGVVRLSGFENDLPSELSGGMRKRAGMARAIAPRPKVIFYDEPTSGLDPVISAMIHALIAELSEKFSVTNIVITHDLAKSFEIADRVAMIFNGNIIFEGNVDEFERCTHPAVRQILTGDLKGPLTSGETIGGTPEFTPSETQIFKINALKELIDGGAVSEQAAAAGPGQSHTRLLLPLIGQSLPSASDITEANDTAADDVEQINAGAGEFCEDTAPGEESDAGEAAEESGGGGGETGDE